MAIALFLALGTAIPVVSYTGEEATDAVGSQLERYHNVVDTNVSVVSSEYNFGTSTLILSVENTGETALTVQDTDVLVDGEYISGGARTTDVAGNGTTSLWARGETLEFTLDTAVPDRVKIVTEYGVATTSEVEIFRLTTDVAFTQSDSLRSVGVNGSITMYGETGTAIGPPAREFQSEDVTELPAVNSSGTVFTVTAGSDRTDLASGARATSSRLTAGRWQGSDASIFFVNSGSQDVIGVTDDGETTDLDTTQAEGVAGIADFDGDGADELIYGGNGPDGNSNSVNYIDDDGTIVGTQRGYGTSSGIGLGEPADFDGDGTVRVPIVDGSNNILLVDSTGATDSLTSTNKVAKAPLSAADLDADTDQEIFFVNETGTLKFLDNVTEPGGNDIALITDDQGNPIPADKDAGAT